MRHETKSVGTLWELGGILHVVRIRGLWGGSVTAHLFLGPARRAADVLSQSLNGIASGEKQDGRHG